MHLCNGNWVLITVNTRLHDVYGYSKLNDSKKNIIFKNKRLGSHITYIYAK